MANAPLCQPSRLGASGDRSDVFDAAAPAGDLANLSGSQRLSSVYTRRGDSQQRGEGVAGRGAFGSHVVASSDENPQCRPDTVGEICKASAD